MIRHLKIAAEAFAVRAVPGLINVGALMALATWMSGGTYGLASTYIATSGAVANLVFGPIIQPALVGHAEFSSRGEHREFENSHVTNAVLIGIAVALVGAVLWLTGILNWRITAAVATFGTYTAIQQISQARIQFLVFAVGSTIQSLAFLALSFLIVRHDPVVNRAIEAYAGSYLIGAVISGALVKVRFAKPRPAAFRLAIRMGTGATAWNVASDIFTLGCRYLLIAFGRLDTLGVFAFSIDLAQRSAGFVINLATFAMVPRALKRGREDSRALWTTLTRAWLTTAPVALFAVLAIVAIGFAHWLPALNRPVYDPASFVLVSMAIIVSRTGKMLLTPVAIRLRQTRLLLSPLIPASGVGLTFVAMNGVFKLPYSAEIGYLTAFSLSTIGSHWLLSRELLKREHFLPPAGERVP
jgi:hypothetical protein